MSIIKREKSTIGMYHVLAQGAGNNELFHDDVFPYVCLLSDTEAVQAHREGGEVPGEFDHAEYLAVVLTVLLG